MGFFVAGVMILLLLALILGLCKTGANNDW